MGSLFKKKNSESPSDSPDPFDLSGLIEESDLEDFEDEILAAALPTVLLELDTFDTDLPATISRMLGSPALPESVSWPADSSGKPMVFLGQLLAEELAAQQASDLPKEGLFSIFIDTLDEDPKQASVLHFSDLNSLVLREPENEDSQGKGYSLKYRQMPSFPAELDGAEQEDYDDFLEEVEDREDTSTCLRFLGHSPTGETAPGRFFLSLHDIEEIGVAWSPSGVAVIRLEDKGGEFQAHVIFKVEEDE